MSLHAAYVPKTLNHITHKPLANITMNLTLSSFFTVKFEKSWPIFCASQLQAAAHATNRYAPKDMAARKAIRGDANNKRSSSRLEMVCGYSDSGR
jgi:hypothetical protein